jgi:metal-responsive CopG/Arc/MetJ family transcriptional regulator
MMLKKRDESKVNPRHAATVRATISFPHELYATLEEIAKQKKVSLAWVVRDAAEQYLAQKWPLFPKEG